MLIRDVPPRVKTWIDEARRVEGLTPKEFVIKMLEKVCDGGEQPDLFDGIVQQSQTVPDSLPFTFVDLFAGIGGLRIGLQRAGGKCVFTSEWDKNSQKTYKRWFGAEPEGDITKIAVKDIPQHDVLAAGFPCRPFSML